jgi:hypothetical protein
MQLQYDDAQELQKQVPDDTSQQQVETLPEDYSQFIQTGEALQDQTSKQEPEEPPSAGDWEQKYKVLKGKYDKEVPRLSKEIKMLKREKEELMNRLSMLEQAVMYMNQTKQQQSQPQAEDDDIVKLRSEYPEIYNAVSKLLSRKIGEIEPKLDEIKQEATTGNFYARLDAMAPNWRTLNTDPDFLDWLNTPSQEVPTMTKHKLMMIAFQQGDATAVAHLFNTYEKLTQNNNNEESEAPMAQKFTAPPHRKAAQSTQNVGKKIYKESEIRQFYTDAALGKISPEIKEKKERDIIQALLENRILYGK